MSDRNVYLSDGGDNCLADICTRLRDSRKRLGLTLNELEKVSGGKWRASIVGAYERGTRRISLESAIELAHFYGVPFDVLVRSPGSSGTESIVRNGDTVLDLRAISQLVSFDPTFTGIVATYVRSILRSRDDWNGEVLSIRQSDVTSISLVLGLSETSLQKGLQSRNLLFRAPNLL